MIARLPCPRLAWLATLLALGACYDAPSSGGSARAHASAATVTACRRRADDIYLRQNRDEIYRADNFAGGTRDTPFSSQGLSGITSSGLGGRYARDNLEEACLNSSSGPGGDASDPASAVAPTLSVRPSGSAGPTPSTGRSPVTQ